MSIIAMTGARVKRQMLQEAAARGGARRPRADEPLPDEAAVADTTAGPLVLPPTDIDQGAQGYANQLVRYIPTEVIGPYVATLAVIPQLHNPTGCGEDFTGRWLLFGFFLLLCPVIAWIAYREQRRRSNVEPERPLFEAIASSLAFIAWTSAIVGSPVFDFCWWRSYVGGVLVIIVSGVILPLTARALGKSVKPNA